MKQSSSVPIQAWVYVFVQAIILISIVAAQAGPKIRIMQSVVVGWFMIILGILVVFASAISIRTSLTAAPIPKKGARLSTSGLYHYVRHPMYSGVILLSLGISAWSGNLMKFCLVICLAVLFYYKSRYEEKRLSETFSEYLKYSQHTPRFIPFSKR